MNTTEACRLAAVKYHSEKYASEEFRTDRALKSFWQRARELWDPLCSSDGRRVAVVDVGANAGEALGRWVEWFIDTPRCERNEEAANETVAPSSSSSGKSGTMILAVEPNPQNAALLRQRAYELQPRLANGGSIVVVQAATAHFNGEYPFLVDRSDNRPNFQGNERGRLHLDHGASDSTATQDVFISPVRTLDAILHELEYKSEVDKFFDITIVKHPQSPLGTHDWDAVTNITLMKIDAEGLDAAVLYGAKSALQRTSVVVFECHKLWKERTRELSAGTMGERNRTSLTLREVVEYLAKVGFQSYKIGLFYWIPITPPFWDDSYEEQMEWSNCIGVREGHRLNHAFRMPQPCSVF
jgi:hypothetical protein